MKNFQKSLVLIILFVNMQLKATFYKYQTIDTQLVQKSKEPLSPVADKVMSEVVVSAMGIKRETKSMSATVQTISSQDLTAVKDPSFMNALIGKTPGITITRSSGANGSMKVVLRGNKSISGSNEPLYIVDGFPITNSKIFADDGLLSGISNMGDGISNINPDDIENMTVIKGATAAALYGSEASNGVILITTKSGSGSKPVVTFSSQTTFEQLSYSPNFQMKYGRAASANKDNLLPSGSQGNLSADANLGAQSWGTTPLSKQRTHPWESFFNTGVSSINSVGLSMGGSNMKLYASYANTKIVGVMPGNNVNRHNLGFNVGGNLFDKIIEVYFKLNYINQLTENPIINGFYAKSPLTNLHTIPGDIDWEYYKNTPGLSEKKLYQLGHTDPSLNPNSSDIFQNWHHQKLSITSTQNPWWLVNNTYRPVVRNRFIIGNQIKINFLKNLFLQARYSVDINFDDIEEQIMKGTTWGQVAGGYYKKQADKLGVTYWEGILNYKQALKNFLNGNSDFTILLGGSYKQFDNNSLIYSNLKPETPNVFSASNNPSDNDFTRNNLITSESFRQVTIASVFSSFALNLSSMVYVDLSYRIDKSSALNGQNSFFGYPAIGTSIILSKIFDLPSSIDLFKIRGGYTIVGNGVPSVAIVPIQKKLDAPINQIQLPFFIKGSSVPTQNASLVEPEMTSTIEFGLDYRMFRGLLNIDLTFYQSVSKNQFIKLDPGNVGYPNLGSVLYANAGEVENTGIELLLTSGVELKKNIQWNIAFNVSRNWNTVKSLFGNLTEYDNSGKTFAGLRSVIRTGEIYGSIYGPILDKDEQGNVRVVEGANGTLKFKTKEGLIANSTPLLRMGISNGFVYKTTNRGSLHFNFLVDASLGGNVVSYTEVYLDGMGLSKATADTRDKGGVKIKTINQNNEIKESNLTAQSYYTSIAGGASTGIGESAYDLYTFDASVIRLRELSLGYTFDDKLLNKLHISALKISFIARNLFYLYKPAPFDPELSVSAGNNYQGIDLFSLPSSTTLGIGINFSIK